MIGLASAVRYRVILIASTWGSSEACSMNCTTEPNDSYGWWTRMSWSRMAVKTLLRLASGGGHLRLEGGLLQVAEPLELAQGQQGRQVDRAGDLVDVAILELECRGREQLGQEVFVGALGDLQPHGRPPLALAEGFLDRREQAAPDLVFLDGQVAVARDAERHPLGGAVAAEERIEPRADDVLEQDEPPLAVGFVGQRDQAVEHRRDLEHGVARSVVRLVGLDPHEQVQALVVHVRKRMRRVDRQRGQDGVDLGVEIVVEISVLGVASAPGASRRECRA